MERIVCKCGASSYGQHIQISRSAHTYKKDKATSQVKK